MQLRLGRARARTCIVAMGVTALCSTTSLPVLASPPESGEDVPFELAWSAPAGCPASAEIVDATRARLRERAGHSSIRLLVEGSVVAQGQSFVVSFVVTDSSGHAVGERQLRVDGRACNVVQEPAALVLAMMIATSRPRVEPSPEVVEEADVEEPSIALPASAPHGQPSDRASGVPGPSSRLALGVEGVTSVGVIPAPTVGLSVRATHEWPSSRMIVGVDVSVEDGRRLHAFGGDVGFRIAGAGAAAGFVVVRARAFELVPTVGARTAALFVTPNGYSKTGDETRFVALLGPGILTRLDTGHRIFVQASLAIEAVLVREKFQLRGGDTLYEVHRPSPVDARFSLGIAYEFR